MLSVSLFSFLVFEILLAFLKHKNWELAFYEVIPQRKIEHSSTQHPDSLTHLDGKIEHSSTQDSLTDPDRKIEHSSIQDSLTDPDGKVEHSSTQDSLTDPDGKVEHTSTQDLLSDPDRKVEHTNTQDDPDRKVEHTSIQDSLTDPDSLPKTQVQSHDETSEEEEAGPCPSADCKERSLDWLWVYLLLFIQPLGTRLSSYVRLGS